MRRSSLPVFAGAMLVSALIGGVSGVLASHGFTDVATNHPFHAEISAVAEAGIARGFNDGTYKPGDAVTRQAMAAFLERGVARAAQDTGTATLNPSGTDVIAEVTVEAGASGSGTGFVVLQGYASARTNQAESCPCRIILAIEGSTNSTVFEISSLANADASARASGAIGAVIPISADDVRTFRLTAEAGDVANCCASVTVDGHLVATYVPLSADGDSTLPFNFSCPQDDGYEDNDDRPAGTNLYTAYSQNVIDAVVCPGDEDWFSLGTIAAGEFINAQVDLNNAQGNIDVCITNNLGTHTVCANTTSNSELVGTPALSNDSYWIRVFLASDAGDPGNTYKLTATVNPI